MKRASCSREEGIKFHRNAREEERKDAWRRIARGPWERKYRGCRLRILSARVEGKRYANISGIPRSILSKFGKHKNSWDDEIIRIICYSRESTSIDIFPLPPKICVSWKNSTLNDASRNRVNSMIDQWPLLSDLYPAYSEIADILLTASRPIVPRSMNRFANAFPFRRRELDWQSVRTQSVYRVHTKDKPPGSSSPQNARSFKDERILGGK